MILCCQDLVFSTIRSQPKGFCFSNEARDADEFGGAVRQLAGLTEVSVVRSSLRGNFHSDYLKQIQRQPSSYLFLIVTVKVSVP